MRALSFGLVYAVPLSAAIGVIAGQGWVLLTPLLVFGLIPSLDRVIGRDTWSPPEGEPLPPGAAELYDVWSWLAAPAQLALVALALGALRWGEPTALEAIGAAVAVGISGGAMGITVAHELIHRHRTAERALGLTLLAAVAYPHWAIEHVAGHHRHVATHDDPATARLGESVYRFLPRTVIGSLRGAWRIERARLARAGAAPLGPANRLLRYAVIQLGVLAAVAALGGWVGVLWFVGQAAVAVGLLEVVNYVEHYGLRRAVGDDGRPQRVAPIHSWNAAEWLTNRMLFHLQRHSDHHEHPRRTYPWLRHRDEAPQLPTGYAGMVLLALVPPLWFAVMDPRVPDEMKLRAGAPSGAGDQMSQLHGE